MKLSMGPDSTWSFRLLIVKLCLMLGKIILKVGNKDCIW